MTGTTAITKGLEEEEMFADYFDDKGSPLDDEKKMITLLQSTVNGFLKIGKTTINDDCSIKSRKLFLKN
jgi:hypothetical protein